MTKLVEKDVAQAAFERIPLSKTIIGGQIEGIAVRGYEIRNANLWNCQIYTSKISHSALHSCKIYSSKIEYSNIFHTTLHEVKHARCGLSCCETSKASLALKRFPPELRNMILAACIQPLFGITPNVVIALRGEPQLYQEALGAWDAQCVVSLKPETYGQYEELVMKRGRQITAVRL